MQEKSTRPIGVFDSGVGGLSVLIELKKLLPHENFVFLADQKYVPYGEKSRKELVKLGYRVTDYFVKHHNIKMMVVACNTSTCNSIDELRARYPFQIVGTVPAVKPAAEQTKTGTVAVICTPSTSKSTVLAGLIKDHCKDVNVLNIGCKNLENTVEEGNLESKASITLLNKYLAQVKNSNADCLVLGCTHYPFLKAPIRKIVGTKIKLIDTGLPIAKRTKALLQREKIENKQKSKGEVTYVTTGNSAKFSKVASKLLKKKVVSQTIKI